jgi:hypothetical protein
MTVQLQQAIQIAKSLSLAEQLELLQSLSEIVQHNHSQETQPQLAEDDTGFSAESFRRSWQQAMTCETLPLSQLWDGVEDE